MDSSSSPKDDSDFANPGTVDAASAEADPCPMRLIPLLAFAMLVGACSDNDSNQDSEPQSGTDASPEDSGSLPDSPTSDEAQAPQDSSLADSSSNDALSLDAPIEADLPETDASPLPDCAVNNGGCDILTTCTMVEGSPQCGACPEPYLGSGQTGCRCQTLSLDGGVSPQDPPDYPNLALHKSYTIQPAPNYSYCTESGDATQLTDGVYTSGYFWTQASTVGWTSRTPIISIDLGAAQTIHGLTFNTAAGVAGVTWPSHIYVFIAGDNQQYHYAGDLVGLHLKHAVLPEMGTYHIHKFWTDEIVARIRYITLVPVNNPYTFVDEIEVFEGDPSFPSPPLSGPVVTDFMAAVTQLSTQESAKRRIIEDMTKIASEAEQASAPGSLLSDLHCELSSASVATQNLALPDANFRAELPLNPLHQRVLQQKARLWQAQSQSALTVWTTSPWDYLPWLSNPPPTSGGRISVQAMQGEHRAAQLNLTNATLSSKTVHVQLQNLPGGTDPAWISVQSVAWTDTASMQPVAQALKVAPHTPQGYSIDIPAGTTRQVWLDVAPQGLTAGEYQGNLVVMDSPLSQVLPMTVTIAPFEMPARPSLHLGGWDYTNGNGSYGVTAVNRDAFIAMLRDHDVDSPWASPSIWPRGTFNAAGHMTTPPSTAEFDAWLAQWPDARRYRVFAAVGNTFGNFTAGSSAFETAVGEWAVFWSNHAQQMGVSPDQIDVLLVDEPHEASQDSTILAWAQAIRSTGAQFKVWEDVTWTDPSQANPQMIAASDTLCPNRQMFLNGNDAFRAFFREQKLQGKTLEFYSCSGPGRLLDPYAYYRLQAWTAWDEGATSMHYWAYGDNGGASSWNEYALVSRTAYTPLFIDEASVTTSKSLEAIREGVEDYEYLRMLRDAIDQASASGVAPSVIQTAQQTLETAAATVLSPAGTAIRWDAQLDRTQADQVRASILMRIDELTP